MFRASQHQMLSSLSSRIGSLMRYTSFVYRKHGQQDLLIRGTASQRLHWNCGSITQPGALVSHLTPFQFSGQATPTVAITMLVLAFLSALHPTSLSPNTALFPVDVFNQYASHGQAILSFSSTLTGPFPPERDYLSSTIPSFPSHSLPTYQYS
jgi:hypothetical protein